MKDKTKWERQNKVGEVKEQWEKEVLSYCAWETSSDSSLEYHEAR